MSRRRGNIPTALVVLCWGINISPFLWQHVRGSSLKWPHGWMADGQRTPWDAQQLPHFLYQKIESCPIKQIVMFQSQLFQIPSSANLQFFLVSTHSCIFPSITKNEAVLPCGVQDNWCLHALDPSLKDSLFL